MESSFIMGEAVSVMQVMESSSFPAIFADPPYNLQLTGDLSRPDESHVAGVTDQWDKFSSMTEYDAFTRRWLTEAHRLLTPDGTIWVMGSYHNIFRVGSIMQDLGFWLLNDIVWHKSNPMPNFRGRRFTNAHETLIWAAKSPKSRHTFNYQAMRALNEDTQMRSDWYLPLCNGHERIRDEQGKKLHNTQKPESLLSRVILSSTNPGDVILDPFGGTGTTAAVAKRLGRKFVYIDQESSYGKAAMERVAKVDALPPELMFITPEKRKSPRVPFGFFVESGDLPPGTTLTGHTLNLTATVNLDGSLSSTFNGQPITGSIHSVAAKLAGKQTCNGWTYWQYPTDHGTLASIDDLRQEELKRRSCAG